MLRPAWSALALSLSLLAATACNAPETVDVEPATDLAPPGQPAPDGTSSDDPNVGPTFTPGPTGTPTPGPTSTPTASPTTVGDECHSDDPNRYCVALRYVAYSDTAGTPVMAASDAIKNLTTVNSIWSQCNVAFQIDEFMVVDPRDYGLTYATKYMSEFNKIRSAFQTDEELLIANTGKWNRDGDINQGNAWANYPGGTYHGVIIEASSAKYAPIVAHELGHYLNLPHVSDTSRVMNPTIYTYSTGVTSAECTKARSAIATYWKKMLR